MNNMILFPWEVAELIRQKTGTRLASHKAHAHILHEDPGHFISVIYGPFFPEDDDIMSIMVCVTTHEQARGPHMQLLVQDCEGDFLNSHAEGLDRERYPRQIFFYQKETEAT